VARRGPRQGHASRGGAPREGAGGGRARRAGQVGGYAGAAAGQGPHAPRKRGGLTSGLDDQLQPLTGIPPRAREMEDRWKGGRGNLLHGKRK
jgi:hypothetical protein